MLFGRFKALIVREKARAGKLLAAERRELDEYLAIESALMSLKSKARLALNAAYRPGR